MGLREEQSGERLHKPGPIQITERETKNETILVTFFRLSFAFFASSNYERKKNAGGKRKEGKNGKRIRCGHLGLDKTRSKLKKFWWHRMPTDLINYIRECPEC